jgi:bloom syndrome protein
LPCYHANGWWKSGCFIIPGLIVQGVTFVISPLKALVFDQMNYLNTLRIIKLIFNLNYFIKRDAIFS